MIEGFPLSHDIWKSAVIVLRPQVRSIGSVAQQQLSLFHHVNNLCQIPDFFSM